MSPALTKRDDKTHKGLIIGVNGNIGVGKSYLCKLLATHFKKNGKPTFVAKEVVLKRWLDKFYGDPKKWAGEFQNNQLNLCANSINVAHARCDTENKIAIVDRTPIGNGCFFFANLENIDQDHRELYEDSFSRCGPYLHSKVVYLDASVDTIYQRIMSRGRESEKNISKEYLRSLDEMMILVELFLHYRGTVPVTFLQWEDYSVSANDVADMITLGAVNGTTEAKVMMDWEKTKDWLLKADYGALKAKIRELSLVLPNTNNNNNNRGEAI